MKRLLLALALLAEGTALPALAGSLSSFEQSARAGGGRGGGEAADACLSDPLLAEIAFCVVGYGGVFSWCRENPDEGGEPDMPGYSPREKGEALIPRLRLDADYQWARPDIAAVRVEGEAGYGPFAAQLSATRFDERRPDDALTLTRLHALYRMSFGGGVEVDLGLGGLFLNGDDRTDRLSFTVPIRYHPAPGLGLEYKPAWSDGVEEYAVGVLIGTKFASLTAGYRWLLSADESLSGPYAGASFHF